MPRLRRNAPRRFPLAAALVAGWAPVLAQTPAPELEPNLGWLNTDRPLRFDGDLAGQVVLLHFWTQSNVSSIHTLEEIEYLKETFAGEAFVVVGVQSSRLQTEADRASVRAAIERYGIEHPVVLDQAGAIWTEYQVEGWPTYVAISAATHVLGFAAGEGQIEKLENNIRALIGDAKHQEIASDGPLDLPPEPASISVSGLHFPEGVLAAPLRNGAPGALYIADTGHHRVLVADWPDENGHAIVRAVYGGEPGLEDGRAEAAKFDAPRGLALDAENRRLYVADRANHTVRRIDLESGEVSTVVGNGRRELDFVGGRAGSAQSLNSPTDVALTPDGSALYVAMSGSNQIWRIDTDTGRAEVAAGSGIADLVDGAADIATLAQTTGLALSKDGGTLYFVDAQSSSVRRLTLSDRRIDTLVGQGIFAFGYADGPSPAALLRHPLGIALAGVDPDSRLIVADTFNSAIRTVDPSTGATESVRLPLLELAEPQGVAAAHGLLFVADTDNHRLVRIDPRTSEWTELMLSGAGLGADSPDRDRPRAADLPMTPGEPLSLWLQVDLGPARSVCREAPVSVRVSNAGGPVVQRTMRTGKTPITMEVPARTLIPGGILRVDLAFLSVSESGFDAAQETYSWFATLNAQRRGAALLKASAERGSN